MPVKKVIASAAGFHAYVIPDDDTREVGRWEKLHDNMGPLRDTAEEAWDDVSLMLQALNTTSSSDDCGIFSTMSDKSVIALYAIAKNKRKGVRPFFADPKTMIFLRLEYQKRVK